MSQENVEMARQAYAALNAAYRTGEFAAAIEKFCDPEIIISPSGILPESSPMRGHSGLIQFTALQTESFDDFRVEPVEFIDAGDRVVVPVRVGGHASHTGLDVTFEVVHVLTARGAKWTRIDMYPTKPEALKAVGLEG